MRSRWNKNSLIYLVIIAALAVFFFTQFSPGQSSKEAPLSQVIEMAKNGQIGQIDIQGDDLTVTSVTGDVLKSRKEPGSSLIKLLQQAGVSPGSIPITVKDSDWWSDWLPVLLTFLPLLLFAGFIFFMMRQGQGAANQAFGFGKSKARLLTGNRPSVTFGDVAGVEEAKQELQEVVEFLKVPQKFVALGARIPRGVLLVGPPGTGKTLLARAVAGEAGVPFFSISGSEFVEMFVGVGASRVRDLFDQAKRNAPCIIFVDEIDAVGRHRGAGLGSGHDEREQTLNQILVEMDGFDSSTNVIVLAATNRPDILDPALLRPGRFDRRVVLDEPDIKGRRAILEVHTKGKPLDESNVDLEKLARQTAGFSGADLANLANEAAIMAARRNKEKIGSSELEEAVDRVIAGPERKSKLISQHEKELVAYHEAGHALVARMLPHADPVHKISIVARGVMGGYTRQLQEDRSILTRDQLNAILATLLGGRLAEQLSFNEMTTGAGNDIERATRVARKMVTEYGMSDRMGPRVFGKKEDLIFLGREISEQRDYGDKVANEIDVEVHSIIEEAHQTAKKILTEDKTRLTRIAEYLIANEAVQGEALEALFDGGTSEAAPAVRGPNPMAGGKLASKGRQNHHEDRCGTTAGCHE